MMWRIISHEWVMSLVNAYMQIAAAGKRSFGKSCWHFVFCWHFFYFFMNVSCHIWMSLYIVPSLGKSLLALFFLLALYFYFSMNESGHIWMNLCIVPAGRRSLGKVWPFLVPHFHPTLCVFVCVCVCVCERERETARARARVAQTYTSARCEYEWIEGYVGCVWVCVWFI